MIDPLPSSPTIIRAIVQPIADTLCLPTLPLHAHEVLFAFCVYHILNTYLSPALSSRFFPTVYPHLPLRTKINWNIHVVSQFQSVFICSLALWVLWTDEERKHMDTTERIWGYTGALGMTQAFAAGYFAWDTMASAVHLNVSGPGALAHAISALIITSLGFRPFANYYGIAFVLYELSTPFLNFHWFFDKCNMTGSVYQLYNGIALLLAFFGCRLVWGTVQSVRVYQDIWYILQAPGSTGSDLKSLLPSDSTTLAPHKSEVMRFSEKQVMPLWLAFVYLGSNTLLTFLNFYWFWKMIEAGRKRFSSSAKRAGKVANQ